MTFILEDYPCITFDVDGGYDGHYGSVSLRFYKDGKATTTCELEHETGLDLHEIFVQMAKGTIKVRKAEVARELENLHNKFDSALGLKEGE
jgi:hypothetical protein